MALINCPECDKQISDKAEICVGCGTPIKKTPNSIIGIPIKFGNLEVAQNDFPKRMIWNDAKKACEALGIGWHLPTKDELTLLFNHKDIIGGFVDNHYWSSTEYAFIFAWNQNFDTGKQFNGGKVNEFYVRAVRTF